MMDEDKDYQIKVLKAKLLLAHITISIMAGETFIEDYGGDIERLVELARVAGYKTDE